MIDDHDQTSGTASEFDFADFPRNTLFHDRRLGRDRRKPRDTTSGSQTQFPPKDPLRRKPDRRVRKDRRRRVDPTTFEKQYTDDEMEFMIAIQRFKERTGKPFPTHSEVLQVAISLGYRKLVEDEQLSPSEAPSSDSPTLVPSAPNGA